MNSDDIDDLVELWHTSETGMPLHEFVGMTELGYATWMESAFLRPSNGFWFEEFKTVERGITAPYWIHSLSPDRESLLSPVVSVAHIFETSFVSYPVLTEKLRSHMGTSIFESDIQAFVKELGGEDCYANVDHLPYTDLPVRYTQVALPQMSIALIHVNELWYAVESSASDILYNEFQPTLTLRKSNDFVDYLWESNDDPYTESDSDLLPDGMLEAQTLCGLFDGEKWVSTDYPGWTIEVWASVEPF